MTNFSQDFVTFIMFVLSDEIKNLSPMGTVKNYTLSKEKKN